MTSLKNTTNTQTIASQIELILCELKSLYQEINKTRAVTVFDRNTNQFFLMEEGWEDFRHIHIIFVHIKIKNDKVWIIEDNIEVGVANRLVEMGVPKT
jgi:XisI protein